MGSRGSCSLAFPKCILRKTEPTCVSVNSFPPCDKRRKVFHSSPSDVMVNKVYPSCVCVCVVCVLGMEWVCTNGRRKLDIK